MIALYIYLINIIAVLLSCRFIPGFNKEVHRIFSTENPVVMGSILWFVLYVILFIHHGSKLAISTMNWVSGNGFVIRTQEKEDCLNSEWTPPMIG